MKRNRWILWKVVEMFWVHEANRYEKHSMANASCANFNPSHTVVGIAYPVSGSGLMSSSTLEGFTLGDVPKRMLHTFSSFVKWRTRLTKAPSFPLQIDVFLFYKWVTSTSVSSLWNLNSNTIEKQASFRQGSKCIKSS